MEPLHGRISYASWRLRVFRQLFLPSHPPNSSVLCRRIHSPNRDRHRQETISQNNTNQHNEGLKSTEIPLRPSQLLPQSPLITNPHPGRAIRHRKKRPPTAADLADLRKNPWAMALASPVRLCTVTGARIPKALLADWGMVEGPDPLSDPSSQLDPNGQKKKQLWLLPVSLMQDDLAPTPSQTSNYAPRPHLKLRIVERLPIIRTLTEWADRTRARKKSALTRLIPFRWKAPLGPVTVREEGSLVWRQDMPEFVLQMMRQEALKQLKRVSDTFKRQDVANGVWRSIDVQGEYSETALLEALERMEEFERMASGVVLVMGEGSVSDASASTPAPVAGVSDFVTIPQLNAKVPVFDLTYLFSQTELEEIRSHHARFQECAVFLRPTDQLTVDAVLALWKLKGYLRPD